MAGGNFRLRVSDSYEVPLRGQVLRLKVVEGTPKAEDFGVGRKLRVRAPDGRESELRIMDHAITGGVFSQERLDKTKEADIVVSREDARPNGEMIDIGWFVEGPVGS